MHVTLVDDAAVGQATAASAGIMQPWSSEAVGPHFDLYAAGAAYYSELLSQLAEVGVTRTDYRRAGSLLVNWDAHALDGAVELLKSRRAGVGRPQGRSSASTVPKRVSCSRPCPRAWRRSTSRAEAASMDGRSGTR